MVYAQFGKFVVRLKPAKPASFYRPHLKDFKIQLKKANITEIEIANARFIRMIFDKYPDVEKRARLLKMMTSRVGSVKVFLTRL